jgi:predicted lipoprotein with Yx(FWY)xxD motif
MPRTSPIVALCLLVALAALLAGCGDDGDPAETTRAPASTNEKAASKDEGQQKPERKLRASIWRASSEDIELGLFDYDGFTLYRFSKERGSKPACYGACAKKWPPLLTEAKPYGVDVVKSKIGTTKRKDGTTQVTYFGHPLYTFVGDKVTGEANGHGVTAFGGTWIAPLANGKDAPR